MGVAEHVPPIIHAVRQGGEPSYTLYPGSVGTQNTLVPSGHVAEGRKLGGCSFIHAQILFDLRDAAAQVGEHKRQCLNSVKQQVQQQFALVPLVYVSAVLDLDQLSRCRERRGCRYVCCCQSSDPPLERLESSRPSTFRTGNPGSQHMQRGSLQMWMTPMGIGDHPSQDGGGSGEGAPSG